MKKTRVTRRRLKARRMRVMGKMKVKMKVQVEDGKDFLSSGCTWLYQSMHNTVNNHAN